MSRRDIRATDISRTPPSVSRTERGRIDTRRKLSTVEPLPGASAAVDAVYRSDWGRIVATLIRLVGDFDVAEEASQEAFAAAVDQWATSGVPEFPRAWIIQTARHKAIDRIRRRVRLDEKLDVYAVTESTRAVEEPDYH